MVSIFSDIASFARRVYCKGDLQFPHEKMGDDA